MSLINMDDFNLFFIQLDNHNCQLLVPLPMALVFLLFRYLFGKYVLTPVSYRLGIKQEPPLKNTDALEKTYQTSKPWNRKQILQLSIKLNISERQVERWARVRESNNSKSSKLNKFCENSWRLMYYTFSFIYGLIVLWNKPWLWDISQCWKDIPNQKISSDVWWYYMISLSFYWSLMFSQFFDVKRKDFFEMFLHHIITILLMVLSWIFRFVRVGTLVLLVHDLADIFLEGAKASHYIKFYKVRDVCFGLFTISWLVTRLGIYPLWIIWDCLTAQLETSRLVYIIFNSLLILLFVLHCFWTCLLVRFVLDSFIPGKMDKDIRSDSDSQENTEHLKWE